MTYGELMRAIASSGPEDWIMHGGNHRVFKQDLNVRIVDSTEEVHGGESESFSTFVEKWADVVPSFHEPPYKKAFTIYYGVSPVEIVEMVGVDGGRGYLPLPRSHEDLTISSWKYQFAKIVEPSQADSLYGLDNWLEKAGISVQG